MEASHTCIRRLRRILRERDQEPSLDVPFSPYYYSVLREVIHRPFLFFLFLRPLLRFFVVASDDSIKCSFVLVSIITQFRSDFFVLLFFLTFISRKDKI